MISGTGNGNLGNAVSVANEQEGQAQQNQQFWDQVYSQFNPQAHVFNTPSSAPGYQQAAQNAQAFGSQLGQVGGGTGSVDMGQANAASNAQAGQLSRTQDLNSYLNDTQSNMAEGDQYTGNAFDRMNSIFGTRNELAGLSNNRQLSNAETQDTINSQWLDYQNQLTPFENLIGSAAGKLGGTIAGSKIFGPQNTKDPAGVESEDDYQPPQV